MLNAMLIIPRSNPAFASSLGSSTIFPNIPKIIARADIIHLISKKKIMNGLGRCTSFFIKMKDIVMPHITQLNIPKINATIPNTFTKF